MESKAYTGGLPRLRRGESVIELPSVQWRKVQVMDHLGDPVSGARVGYFDSELPWMSALLGTTDQAGFAEIPVDAHSMAYLARDEIQYFVQTLAGQGVSMLGSVVGPSETITFRLPRAPRLEIDILGLDGKPYEEPLAIRMSRQDQELNLQGGTMRGKFHVPAVDPNAHVFLEIRSWDDRLSYLQELTLPDADNGVIKLEIRLSKVGFTLRGRLTKEMRAPDANATFRLSLSGYPAEPLLTDSEGRFEIFMGDLYVQPDSTDITITEYEHGLPTVYWKGIAVPIGNRDLIDLGTIALNSAETLASGIVLHEADIPHDNAQVTFEKVEPSALDIIQTLSANTSSDGSFHIRGVASEAGEGPFQLRVTAPGLKSTVYPVQLGQTGMKLTLRRKVQVEGRFLFGDSILSSTLRIRLEESNPTSASYYPRAEMVGGEGNFKAFEVPAGMYSITLSTADGRDLHVEHGIHVPGSPSTVELHPIDLRHSIRYRYVKCVDAQGKRIHDAAYRVEGNERWKSTAYGMAGIFLRNHERDIHVRADGYVTRTVELVDDETNITLQAE
ncbi:MAG: carboxypeptidase-like regulatory domain-containing protein [Planctomycetota bacterium]